MKHWWTRARLYPNLIVTFWYTIAAITLTGLLVSLPGYYLFYIEQPIRLHYTGYQIILTFAGGLASLLSALISIILAMFLFLRKRGDRAALFVSFYLLVYAFVMCGPFESGEYFLFHQSGIYSYRVQAVIFTPLTLCLLLIFPNGKITPSGFRWLAPFTILLALIMSVLPINEINSITTLWSKLIYLFTAVLFLSVLGGQVYRYLRKSSPIERQQTKIVLYGIGIQFLFLVISSTYYFQIPAESQGKLIPEQLSGSLFWIISLSLLPISLTLAVIRSHLWDIDVVIRRTLIYGFLTITLAFLYFGSVILIQNTFRLASGHESPVAIVISTLTIAGLFTPLRRTIQAAIDRHFYRSKYNSEQALARFQKSMRERVDLDQVEKELIDIVQVTVQPDLIMIWMRNTTKE